jgi:hypothetical protein
MNNEKTAFAAGVLLVGFAIFQTLGNRKNRLSMRNDDHSSSNWKRNETARIQSKYGINTDLLNTRDLSIYPEKNGDPSKSTLSKAIVAIAKGEDEFYEQSYTFRRAHNPSNGTFLPRETVVESDGIYNREIRLRDASDVNYQQHLLVNRKISKRPTLNKVHDYNVIYDNQKVAQFFGYDN